MERFVGALQDDVVAEIGAALRPSGLDIVFPFRIDGRLDGLFAFPRFGRDAALGLLIGNSRALWRPFIAWQRAQAEIADPLDDYVEDRIAIVLSGRAAEIFFTRRRGTEAPAVPFQRLGREIGFAALGPAHLNVHPDFGPWFAFRAVVALDRPPLAVEQARPALDPCRACAAPCRAPFEAAMARAQGRPERASVRNDWLTWLAVRDACPVGRAARYDEAQIGYHYTKERRHLHEDVIGA